MTDTEATAYRASSSPSAIRTSVSMLRPSAPASPRDHTPPGTMITSVERMSPAFVKYWLSDGTALHRFTSPEPHADPHDHPMRLDVEVLSGGYVEEVFTHDADGWRAELVHRLPGATHMIAATHIHRVVELPAGECWTRCRYGWPERQTRFWRFGDEVVSRAWHSWLWERV